MSPARANACILFWERERSNAQPTHPEQSLSVVYPAIGFRRGTIFEEQKVSRCLISVKAYLPVAESFGTKLNSAPTSDQTSGRAFLQMNFDHWELVLGDPFVSSKMVPRRNPSAKLIRSIRIQKGLAKEIPDISQFLDTL
ncbi:hypothetical protein DFA_06754 [Cavenderia fasciculata]|uniref:Elongation factor EFG domain-containing protein n=1 Tax=Cavenderia fasciculata TaxID=261658 RepID=F4Q267_CACFS|nr:uncharacterized protein DFA_06754 [Cavenderia fasciculata]EGG18087.1 hypothetical protein DFA_06754 [Cavenderia fasciculata]|eukprot:XP_004366128.1 hypothetical protein DFA_06754 [Cavenderia fasciculata]